MMRTTHNRLEFNILTQCQNEITFFTIIILLILQQVGVYAEGLEELLADNGFQSYVSTRSLSVGQYHNTTMVFPSDLARVAFFLFQLQNWGNLPNNKVIMSPYLRTFGQEWFYADLTKEDIEQLIKVRLKNTQRVHGSPQSRLIEQEGLCFLHAAHKAHCPFSSDHVFRMSVCLRGEKALCGL